MYIRNYNLYINISSGTSRTNLKGVKKKRTDRYEKSILFSKIILTIFNFFNNRAYLIQSMDS